MKRFLLPLIILAFTNLQLYSKSIDEATAKSIATTFFSSISSTSQLKNGVNVELIYKAIAPTDPFLKSSPGSNATQTTYFYIFSSSKLNNFVIVSGDDRAKPILGYSNTNPFDPGNIPPNMKVWLDGYSNEIQYAIDKDLKAYPDIMAQWNNLSQGISMDAKAIVAPLIQTHWAQSPYYNDLCPYDNTVGELVSTGCTATAMAQIMKYWNYPDKGTGTHAYIPFRHPEYGVISADFGNTKYNWSSMPDQISAPNEEIAKLMFQCGVSTNMDYGTDQSTASLQQYNHPSAILAFRDYFSYKSTNKLVKKSGYLTSNEWINVIKVELNSKRPVLYAGGGESEDKPGGHAFVCDGFDNNNYFHFNWGWGGHADGYFTTDALNIIEGVDLTSYQHAIIGIEPVTTNPVVDIRMNSKVSISPSIYITPGQPFTLTTEFKNYGATAFDGFIMAIAWDDKYNFVSLIDSSKTFTLPGGAKTEILSFSTKGISAMTSGAYYITFYSIFSDNTTKAIEKSITKNGVYELIKVTVSNNNAISEDEYENNNSENTAFELIPVFNSNVASIKIQSNIHNTSDIDYYQIKLPIGYTYIIASFLDDFAQKKHTLDGKYSYKLANDSWSTPEDIDIPDFIYQGKDDCLYFKVEPFLAGYMGTYELSFTITREENEITPIQGMVAYYPFNGNANDESGNGNNGKIYGATLTEDRFGNSNSAFWFNGISDFIQVPDAASLDMTSKMSISGWLKKDKNVPWANMLTKGGESGIENNYSLQLSENNGMIFTTDNQSTKSSKSLSLNEWHFVTFTWDGDTAKIYLDGVADSSSFTLLSNAFVPNNSSLYIGVDKPFSDEYFSGYLDDLMIFNREINRTEVALLNSGTFTRIAENKKKSSQQLQVFPNPTTNFVTITFNNPGNHSYDLYISNVMGGRVLCIASITANMIKLNNLNLPKGIYLIEMKGRNTQKGKMIVIE